MPPPARRPPPAKFSISPLGIAAIVLGVGVVGAFALDLHRHQCAACTERWWHLGAFNLGSVDAHRCANCGEIQWWKGTAEGALRPPQYRTPATPSTPGGPPGATGGSLDSTDPTGPQPALTAGVPPR